jgi:hypothetical protein
MHAVGGVAPDRQLDAPSTLELEPEDDDHLCLPLPLQSERAHPSNLIYCALNWATRLHFAGCVLATPAYTVHRTFSS